MNPESLNLSNMIKPSVGFEAKKVAMSELLKKATIAVRSHWSWCCTLLGVWKMLLCKRKKCQGGHGNGEAKLPETLSRSFKNPDLIILISCTELFVSRIFWCIVIYWYALTIDIYSLAVVCDSVCVFQFSLVCLMSFSLHLSVLGVGPQAAIRGPKHAWCSAWWEKPYRISFLCRIFGWHVWQIFR